MAGNTKEAGASDKQECRMCIVGIGSSAGGLEALEAFFYSFPNDTGVAFVLVAHQDPERVSLLPSLLQKRTGMPVAQAEHGVDVLPNTIHIIPPNKALSISDGKLLLGALPNPRGKNLPIDSFLCSLAADQGSNAVCVILSGTGTDGTAGAEAIKDQGGLVLAQEEASARYNGMPHSVISAGLADLVAPASEMASHVIAYANHRLDPKEEQDSAIGTESLERIFAILYSRTNHDFSLYKKNTICRRIERRMNAHQLDCISDYAAYLDRNEHEVKKLFKELLIGVTSFFRDPAAFDSLQQKVLDLLSSKPTNYSIRVWVPGCSTGEEVYSIAILLRECIRKVRKQLTVQIFGTDIDEAAIAIARTGLYPPAIESNIKSSLLKRYFIKEDTGHYRIRKSIREMIVFAPQNVIKDPPFTKLDLISCRNLMIYLGPELQRRLLPLFHYSLRLGGLLFLGSSESVGQTSRDLFETVDKKWQIHTRRTSASNSHSSLPLNMPIHEETPVGDSSPSVQKAEELSALQLVETILHQSKTPPCAIIDGASNVVYIHGRTGRYLEPAQGKASVNLLDMARPGLRDTLSIAVRKAAKHRSEVIHRGVRISDDRKDVAVDVTIRPVLEQGAALSGLLMVVFTEPSSSKDRPDDQVPAPTKEVRSVEELVRELETTRESLQATIEELETANEELRLANEELQSTNEELQSTNEELETSKEELQSLNEESITVNSELQGRIDELDRANDDIRNLLDSTEIATVFLDGDFCVRRFTPKLTEIIPLTPVDTGRPISHFSNNLIDVDLEACAKLVLTDLVVRSTEVRCTTGGYFTMQIRPYRTADNVIAGTVVMFQDITPQREQALSSLRHLAAVMLNSNDAIIVHDLAGRIQSWNPAAGRMYGYSEEEAVGMTIDKLRPPDERGDAEFVEKVIRGIQHLPLLTERLHKNGDRVAVKINAIALSDSSGKTIGITTTESIL